MWGTTNWVLALCTCEHCEYLMANLMRCSSVCISLLASGLSSDLWWAHPLFPRISEDWPCNIFLGLGSHQLSCMGACFYNHTLGSVFWIKAQKKSRLKLFFWSRVSIGDRKAVDAAYSWKIKKIETKLAGILCHFIFLNCVLVVKKIIHLFSDTGLLCLIMFMVILSLLSVFIIGINHASVLINQYHW